MASCASRACCQGHARCQPPVFPQAQFPRRETPYVRLGRASARPGLEAGQRASPLRLHNLRGQPGCPHGEKVFLLSTGCFERVFFEVKEEDLLGAGGKSARFVIFPPYAVTPGLGLLAVSLSS